MHRLLAQLKAARSMPPRLVAAKLLRRAGLGTAAVRRAEVLNNPQTREHDRLAKLYVDFAAQAEAAGWLPVDFAGARVLEVGCGPLAGLAPYVVPAGAAAYLGVDPGADPALLRHPDTARRYLTPALAASRRHAPGAAEVEIGTFLDRAQVFRGTLDDLAGSQAPFDAAVSISCLEHIDGLGDALATMKQLLKPDARQLHLVNFSNHLDKAAPFKHLYDLAPEEHRRRYGRHINLLRPQEVLAAFVENGFDARLVPVDIRPEAVPEPPHPWWAGRYPKDELAIRTALIVC